MGLPRRSLAFGGGALVLLAAVGVGLAQANTGNASATPTAVTTTVSTVVATTEAADAVGAFRAALRGPGRGLIVHGTVTIDHPREGLITVQVDGGTVSAVDADSVTIAEKGGGSVTVAIDAQTRVRRDRKRATPADLKVGDTVRVVSRVETGGTATAKVIVVPPAARS